MRLSDEALTTLKKVYVNTVFFGNVPADYDNIQREALYFYEDNIFCFKQALSSGKITEEEFVVLKNAFKAILPVGVVDGVE